METDGDRHPAACRRSTRERIPNVNRREVLTIGEAAVERERELQLVRQQRQQAQGQPLVQEPEPSVNGM